MHAAINTWCDQLPGAWRHTFLRGVVAAEDNCTCTKRSIKKKRVDSDLRTRGVFFQVTPFYLFYLYIYQVYIPYIYIYIYIYVRAVFFVLSLWSCFFCCGVLVPGALAFHLTCTHEFKFVFFWSSSFSQLCDHGITVPLQDTGIGTDTRGY